MRVLICTVGAPGHINPLLPLARGLRSHGHEVAWATNPGANDAIARAGISVLPVGSPFGVWMRRLGERTRGLPGAGVPGPRKPSWFVPRLFCEVGAADVVDDLLAAARGYAPDLIVFESRSYAAPAVAAALGIPQAKWEVTGLLPAGVEESASDAISPLWDELGLGTPHLAGVFDGPVFSPYPASLDAAPPEGVRLSRVAPVEPCLERPDWLDPHLLDRPLVYATLGTAFSAAPVMNALLEALGAAPVRAVVTMGNLADRSCLHVPLNVRVEQYVEQERLLPHCSAVLSHAGSGTMLGALAHGLPQVCVPQGADQFLNAGRIQQAGAGVAVFPAAATAEAIGAALAAVLTDSAMTRTSRALAAEMHAGLGLDEVVAALEETAGRNDSAAPSLVQA